VDDKELEYSQEICRLKHLDVDRRIQELRTLLYAILTACVVNPIVIAIIVKML